MTRIPPLPGRARRLVLGLALAGGLSGCASDRGIAPARALPVQDALARELTLGEGTPAPLPARDWWKKYGDAGLERWIETGLRDNPAPRIAEDRLARAQAIFDEAAAARLPALGFEAQSTVQRFSANGIFPPPLGGTVHSLNDVDFAARWDADFFGRVAARISAARERIHAAQALSQDARLRLAGAIAHAYFALAQAERSLALSREDLALRERQLALVSARAKAGLDTEIDRRTALGPVPLARLDIERARERVALCRNALAALAGAGPQAATEAHAVLPAAPLLAPPASLPLDLLARRADVAAALAQARATQREVEAARADFYPDVQLSALVGLDALGTANLFRLQSRTWAVTPALHLPLFAGGSLRARLREAGSESDAAIDAYRQAVLAAAREAADALASVHANALQRGEQEAALGNAQSALLLASARRAAGLGNELPEIAARGAVLAQERAQLELALRGADLDVSLALALGGGYEPGHEPEMEK